MSGPIVITLAGKPEGKGRPRIGKTRSGHAIAFTPAKTRSYEASLRYCAEQAMGSRQPLTGACTVEILAVFPIPGGKPKKWQEAARRGEIRPTIKPDFDNLAKVVDGINTVVFVDDKQVVDGRVIKVYGDRPRLEITVTEIQAAGALL